MQFPYHRVKQLLSLNQPLRIVRLALRHKVLRYDLIPRT